MDWNTVRDHWPRFGAPLMQRFPDLTEARLAEIDGDREALVAEIALREALPSQEAADRLEAFLQGPMPADLYAGLEAEAAVDSGDYIEPGEDALADDHRFGDADQPAPPLGRRD